MSEQTSLTIMHRAAQLLAEANTIQKAKELKNLALTAADWARRHNEGEESIKLCRAYALDAERRMGELLRASVRDRGRPKKIETEKPDTSSGFSVTPTLEDLGVSEKQSSRAQRLAEMPMETFERVKLGELSRDKAAHVAHNTGENEWYTPSEYIEAARVVMGSIDCDPASSTIANQTVRASLFYSAEENGLEQPWHGNVWLNPPYAQPLISQFADVFIVKWNALEIPQGIILVNNATETAWFATLVSEATSLCFPRGRIRFFDPQGNMGAPLQGQAFLYYGEQEADFHEVFRQFGVVCHVLH